MNDILLTDKGLFETLEEKLNDFKDQLNTKNEYCEEEKKYEFLIQDMFLEQFFP